MSEALSRRNARIPVGSILVASLRLARSRGGQRLAGLAMCLVVTLPALALDSLVSAEQALRRMRVAATSLNYRGTATYEQAGALTTLQVTHAVDAAGRRERLEYLDGPSGEVVNVRGSPGCARASGVDLGASVDVGMVVKHYRAAFLDDGRIAGRPVTRFRLQPRDDYRYGHLLSIDRETGLLLQALTLDQQGQLVDRFQFSEIAIGMTIDAADLESRLDSQRVLGSSDCDPVPSSGDVADREWVASWVPPGFVPFEVAPRETGGQEMHYTDGFNSVSIFVEPETDGGPMLEARHGPTMAYIRRHQGREGSYRICVVGEVPMPTARRIAAGVEFDPGNYPAAEAAERAER